MRKKTQGLLKLNYDIARFFYSYNIPLLPRFFQKLNRVLFSCDIPYKTRIGNQVRFGHNGLGTVVHPKTQIGNNCLIMQNVTIGGNNGKYRIQGGQKITYPIIGNNVFIGPNVVIIGPVVIEDNVQIGAGSVVMKSITKNTVVAGIPADVIRVLDDDDVVDVSTI